MQDPDAARVIFDSGVPFVQIPLLKRLRTFDHTQRAG